MATPKSRRNSPPLGVIFGVIAALVVAVFAIQHFKEAGEAKREQARADADIPVLPSGRLRLIGTSVKEARFLALDGASKEGDFAEGVVLVVSKSPTGFEGAGMMSQRKRFDCVQKRVFDGAAGYFDVDGQLLTRRTFYVGKRGRPTEPSEIEAAALCGATPAEGKVLAGFQAAQRDIQTPPDDIDKRAEAQPEDANLFAWLCAAGARERWRKETPTDCDKAVKLTSGATETRMDRAFLNYKIGKEAAAISELKAIVAAEPDNAAALFGLGLMEFTAGDRTASRTHRARALEIDPKIPDWLQARYTLTIGQVFRTV